MIGAAEERRIAGRFPHLAAGWPGEPVRAGVTTRELDFGGSTATPSRDAGAARAAFREWARTDFRGMVGASQVHGARLFAADGVAVPDDDGAAGPWALRVAGYDGFLTAEPGILLTASVADCVPAVLWAPDTPAVALCHAGWRGVAAGIVPRAVVALSDRYGASPSRLRAWWGPAIGSCCYEVGPEVVAAIGSTAAGAAEGTWHRGDGRSRVDLRAALSRQAEAAGVDPTRISTSSRCTACDGEVLHSHRRARGGSGRMMAFAGIPRTLAGR
ncbi:MAG TPA: polyphenol oxidase family protein [Gemmatimonadota bacterium]|nr:polyphenol oxidase family protein [Gemmatimonadota bacterium]